MSDRKVPMVDVRMLKQTFYGDKDLPARTFYVGEVYKVPEQVSARWIQRRIAEVSVKSVPLEQSTEDAVADDGFTSVPGMKELLGKRKR